MNKTIGIVGYMSDGRNLFGAGVNHLEFLSKFGNPRIILPTDDVLDLDLLYLPGGMDLNPAVYGQAPSYNTSNTDVFKQYFYDNKLQGYIDKGTPIFGVCLGAQMLAAKFGSKLTQELTYHAQSKGRWETAHDIYPFDGTHLHVKDKLPVNSHHHQGVLLEDLSPELVPVYVAKNEEFEGDKQKLIVEVFRHKAKPIVGVQYHPEELYDHVSQGFISSILNPE